VKALLHVPNAVGEQDLRSSLDTLAGETKSDIALGERMDKPSPVGSAQGA
jgi:hypothetical protein